jgi:hypothetical protein
MDWFLQERRRHRAAVKLAQDGGNLSAARRAGKVI